jgi:hypothetical protein
VWNSRLKHKVTNYMCEIVNWNTKWPIVIGHFVFQSTISHMLLVTLCFSLLFHTCNWSLCASVYYFTHVIGHFVLQSTISHMSLVTLCFSVLFHTCNLSLLCFSLLFHTCNWSLCVSVNYFTHVIGHLVFQSTISHM